MRRLFYVLIISTILIVLLAISGVTYQTVAQLFYYSPCDTPIRYKIGTIDNRFQISQEEYLVRINQAATIWNTVTGKNLFVYDSKGTLSFHLVYDQRQSLNNQIGQLETQLQEEENQLKPELESFKTRSIAFEKKLETLNNQISYWNSRGGAPHDEYIKLKKEQEELQQEAEQLNSIALRLNQSTAQFNNRVGQLSQTVDSFNQTLQQQPEEGLYDSRKKSISIYLTKSTDELIHTLAHEMGHAWGIDHINNPFAIMYPYSTETTILTQEDVSAIQKVCEKRSIIELLGKKLVFAVVQIQQEIEKSKEK